MRQTEAEFMTEEELRRAYIKVANMAGYDLQYHTHDSRRSAKGFPDDVFISTTKKRIVFIEAKSDTGIVKPEQTAYHDALAKCDVEIYLVRPENLEEITEILTLGHKPSTLERCNYNCAVVAL